MPSIARRNLLGTILSGAAAAQIARPANERQVTRHIDEMTSREVEFYINDGGDLAFIPFGPVSGHGQSDVDLAVEVLHKCAELALPALESFAHYQKWLADHPMEFIRAKTRLGEK